MIDATIEAPPAGTPPVAPPVTPPAGEAPPVVPPVTPPVVPPVAPPAGDPAVPPVAPAAPAAAAVPDKYELKLPDKPAVDTAVVERTAAIARELGLSQDNAQKTLEFVNQEVASKLTATLAEYAPPSETNKEGGAQWKEQDATWRAAALADKDLGAGKPEELVKVVEGAKRVLAQFGDEESIGFFEKSGLGSHPGALRLLNRIAKAMSEGSNLTPIGASRTEEDALDRLYPSMAAKKA